MRYVLDSSVAYKWEVPEPDSDKAIRLRDDYRRAIHELIAPDFFSAELAHALTRAERQKPALIATGEAELLWLDVMITPPAFFPSQAITQRAIQISSRFRVGVYDCAYVALAEREGCEFVTADKKLVNNLQSRFPFIVPLASLP